MKVGVLVARMQYAELHRGYHDMIDTILKENNYLLIILGDTGYPCTVNNPLSVEERKKIIATTLIMEKNFFNFHITSIKDQKDDHHWSELLDKIIDEKTNKNEVVTLYGSRDSFIPRYHGKKTTKKIEAKYNTNSTKLRKHLLNYHTPKSYLDYLKGKLQALSEQFPVAYTTVDNFVIDFRKKQILLGKKKGYKKHVFPGGFLDPKDKNYKEAAIRELHEECGKNLIFNTANVNRLGEFKIHDWRYQSTQNRIFTNAFLFSYEGGEVKAGDDLESVAWFPLKDDMSDVLENNHNILYNHFKSKFL